MSLGTSGAAGCCGCRPVTCGGGVGRGEVCGQCKHASDSRTSLGGHRSLGKGRRLSRKREKGCCRSSPSPSSLAARALLLHPLTVLPMPARAPGRWCVSVWRGRVRDAQWKGSFQAGRTQPGQVHSNTDTGSNPLHTSSPARRRRGVPPRLCPQRRRWREAGGEGEGARTAKASPRSKRRGGAAGIDRCASLQPLPGAGSVVVAACCRRRHLFYVCLVRGWLCPPANRFPNKGTRARTR